MADIEGRAVAQHIEDSRTHRFGCLKSTDNLTFTFGDELQSATGRFVNVSRQLYSIRPESGSNG
jgi:hypothetical protein